ncbi:hypothetical protein ANN_06693 [Periplaneta americana]|uniref:DUF4817 domain-containing protein n=1 Tax=Periplaneta americana TaxID=6978 RepID=A0ABQ8TED1_PERAM|nr:hypothetical protein ANN_06693 [Periplaneta americana]
MDSSVVQSNHQLRMDVYTFPELADMVMCYGEARGNGRRALYMYQQQFQNRNHPHHTMFARLYQRPRDDGSLRPRRIVGRPRHFLYLFCVEFPSEYHLYVTVAPREDLLRFEDVAKSSSGHHTYAFRERRRGKRPLMLGDRVMEGTVLKTGADHFRISTDPETKFWPPEFCFWVCIFQVILNSLCVSLKERSAHYKEHHEKFGFLESSKTSETTAVSATTESLSIYKDDLDSTLHDECLHMKSHLKLLMADDDKDANFSYLS